MEDQTIDSGVSTELEDIDTSVKAGAGSAPLTEPQDPDDVNTDDDEAGESVRESLVRSMKEIDNKDKKDVAKVKDSPKVRLVDDKGSSKKEREDTSKDNLVANKDGGPKDNNKDTAAVKDSPEQENEVVQEKETVAERKPDPRRHEAPAHFMPKAKEKWYNTPREVQSEVARMAQSHSEELKSYQESKAFHEELKDFDDLAKKSGTSVKQALTNYISLERTLASNPGQGFRQIIENMGLTPQQAIAAIASAYGGNAQSVAQHMAKNAHEYTLPSVRQQPMEQAQPQTNSQIEQLQQRLNEMEMMLTHKQYVEPFINEHPRYHELERDIEFFLQSGRIPSTLSPTEKLEAAYDMAERLNPSPVSRSSGPDYVPENHTVKKDLSGRKSVKTSPGSVKNTTEPARKQSMRDMLYELANQRY